MDVPTPEQMRKFFDKFFELIRRRHITERDMDALMAELESGIWREFRSDTTGHELLTTLPPEKLKPLMKPIEALVWNDDRIPGALRGAHVEHVWQLAVRTELELLKLKGIGQTALSEIRSNLEAHGLWLGMKLLRVARTTSPTQEQGMEAELENAMLRHLWRSVDELGLSARAQSACREMNCQWVWQLVAKTEAELLKTRGFGRKSLHEIKGRLAGLGLALGIRLSELQLQPKSLE